VHANLDIVLASTIRNPPADVVTDRGTNLSDANETIEDSDSDYESGPAGDTAGSVTGAPCRKTDPKIATAPKTQSRSKDQNKDEDNSKENQAVKLNIVKPESFTQ